MRKHLCVSAFALLVALGCSSDMDFDVDPVPLWQSGQAERRVVPLVFDTLFHRDGRDDPSVIDPSLPRWTPHGVAIVESIDQEIVLYDTAGNEVWRAGGRGEGPGEFENIRDLRLGSEDRLVVYDVGNGKLATLDVRTGAVTSELRLAETVGVAESMVPLGDSTLFVTFRPEEPLVVLDMADGSATSSEMPWPGFRRLHALHRQGITAAEGGRWVYLFRYGNGFFPFTGTEPGEYLGQFVEHLPFPALSVSETSAGRSTSFRDNDPCSACSASLVGDTLFVHFGGWSEHAARILDAYDVRTGDYLVSYQLPTFLEYVEVGPDWIAVVREDPFPELILLSRGRAGDGAAAP